MNSNPITPPTRPRSFILRLVVDAHGELRGQISEPGCEDEWRTTFVGKDELWSLVVSRLNLFNQSTSVSTQETNAGDQTGAQYV